VSALRQLLSAIRAAVWLRARLLGLKLRRRFGSAPEADAGPDFQSLGVDVLAAEATHELPAELAARLDLTRAELVEHARRGAPPAARPRGARRRRRIASIVLAALLGLGAVGAGASALVSGSTGVPAVDRLLGIYESGLDRPDASERPGPSGSDLQPSPSKASEPIELTLADGSRFVASFYVARDGRICVAVTDADGGVRFGDVQCAVPDSFRQQLARDDVIVLGTMGYRGTVVTSGLVSTRAKGLKARVEPLDIVIGEDWIPDLQGADSVRPFVGLGKGESPVDPRDFAVEPMTE
jgi:hypothetical protein